MKKYSILLIEDNSEFRDCIVTILRSPDDLHLAHASGSPDEPLPKIHRLRPNVFLLELGSRS